MQPGDAVDELREQRKPLDEIDVSGQAVGGELLAGCVQPLQVAQLGRLLPGLRVGHLKEEVAGDERHDEADHGAPVLDKRPRPDRAPVKVRPVARLQQVAEEHRSFAPPAPAQPTLW